MDRPNDYIQATVTVSYSGGQFYTNASLPDGSFICTVGQHNLDISVASAMEWLREGFRRMQEARSQPIDKIVVTRCPVCGEDCGSNEWLQEHMLERGHVV